MRCTVDDCEGAAECRQMCAKHYARVWRHGSADARKVENGTGRRLIEKLMAAPKVEECIFWPLKPASTGYARITENGKQRLVHRELCERENGPPPSRYHQAAHNCGKGLQGCVNRFHLRWATAAENAADRELHNTIPRGVSHVGSKLTDALVRKIRAQAKGQRHQDIADRFGVHRSTVQGVTSGRYWGHVQ